MTRRFYAPLPDPEFEARIKANPGGAIFSWRNAQHIHATTLAKDINAIAKVMDINISITGANIGRWENHVVQIPLAITPALQKAMGMDEEAGRQFFFDCAPALNPIWLQAQNPAQQQPMLLRDLRSLLNINQSNLAKALGVSQPTPGAWENVSAPTPIPERYIEPLITILKEAFQKQPPQIAQWFDENHCRQVFGLAPGKAKSIANANTQLGVMLPVANQQTGLSALDMPDNGRTR